MIVRLLSVLCVGVVVAAVHNGEGNNDNEENRVTIELLARLTVENFKELCPHLATRIHLQEKVADFITAHAPTESVVTQKDGEESNTNLIISLDDISISQLLATTTETRSFPNFDLETLLKTTPEGNNILNFYETNRCLNTNKRNQLTDIIIKHIYTHIVNGRITYEDYNILAAKIITLFPKESLVNIFLSTYKKRDSLNGRSTIARGKLVDKVRNLIYKYGDHRKKRNNSNCEKVPPAKHACLDLQDVPYLELAEPEEGYHGLIRENETLVEVTPAIRARGPLCSFLILNNKHHGEAPFEIMVIDENEARLRVRFPLNCEKRRNYKFDIAAVGCDGSYSNTVPVHITVTDVNEFAPVFGQASYVKAVDEGRVYDEILRVEATDRDCTPRYGDVCKYEILTDRSQPFTIDNEGMIRNTEPLDYEKSHNHILSVVAYDCGMLESSPVMVTIKVNKPCRAGWKGVAERVDYAPGTGPLALFPAARLEACSSDERCPGVTRIQAAVTLQASRQGSGCDRDTYSLHSQRTICGLDPKTIDLLPSPGAGNEWTKSLKPDSGRDGEQMFEFDGETTSAIVPEAVAPHALAGSFAVSVWMRHAAAPDHDKHRKEHVLCLADDHKMNRHHYALFVRNCRLILLLRRDFGDGDLNIFRPAEWRWKIPEVCDNEWHHYAINVRFPNVELFVDGELYRAADGAGPEVIDDWPLHPAHGVNTTLVVGACWQGTESDMKHHLHGWLAGLGILRGSVQPARSLQCVSRCREGLSLAPDLYLRSVSVEGDGVADVETLLRRVAYGDARAFPTPGRRNVHVATTITCDNGRILRAKPADSYVMVLQPQTPTILLNGSADAARDYAHFRAGLRVFPELGVHVVSPAAEAAQKLDSCVVSVYPALNPDHEALSLRDASELPLRYDIRAAITRDGVILTGADSVHNYQKVLREIEYSNKKPAYYLNRVFKLTCSELNGRFTSNEYVQTLTVVHPHMSGGEALPHELHPSGMADKMDAVARDKQPAHAHAHADGHQLSPRVYAAHAQRDAHAADVPAPRVLDLRPEPAPATNHVALLIGVVSCGVVVVVAGVAWARARGARGTPRRAAPRPQRLAAPPDAEMAWDDSALTITVNPMDESARAPAGGGRDSSDGESCSDSESDRHDSSDDDDDAPHATVMSGKQHKYRNISQLEWDNSTM